MNFTEKELAEYYSMTQPLSEKSFYFMHLDNLQSLADTKNSYGADLIYFLVKNDNVNLYNNLSYKGVKFKYDNITQSGETLLHTVKDIRMLETLLLTDAKKLIHIKDKKDNTLLHRYIDKPILLKKIAPFFQNYNDLENKSKPLLKNFTVKNYKNVNDFLNIYQLFDGKLNISFEFKNGNPFLFSLVHTASPEQIKKMFDLGIDFSILSTKGNNLASYLIESGLYEKISLLDLTKIDLNHKNKEGKSPLILALDIENGSAVKYLIQGGLNPTQEEIEKWLKTPIETAMEAFVLWLSKEGNIEKIKKYNLLKESKSYINRIAENSTCISILEKMILEETLDDEKKPIKKMKL
jgi:hypothetical protein